MQFLKEHPCPNCNSELNYDADKNALKCLHCGAQFPIEKSSQVVEENNIQLFKDAAAIPLEPVVTVTYKCSKCGQETQAGADIAFFECRNCGNNVLNPEAYKTRTITPTGILPFQLSKQEALDIFKQWIGKGFWNDSSLKELSLADKLEGHYIPFFTFDCHTYNHWEGYAGTYYYETIRTKDANGKEVTQNIQRTRWYWREGSFERFFDDILVCGNKRITQEQINTIYPFNLQQVELFNPEYLLGWHAQAFDKALSDTFNAARNEIDNRVHQEAAQRLADDTYKDLSVQTRYTSETFKQVILPVWLCQYLFKGKTYHFIINGQTGAISGKKPLSASKIVIAIIIAIIIIAVLYGMSQ
jgi:DNA-directed RNA polymerase subunit RPC12/RpoP